MARTLENRPSRGSNNMGISFSRMVTSKYMLD